jgi:hypothetical protein
VRCCASMIGFRVLIGAISILMRRPCGCIEDRSARHQPRLDRIRADLRRSGVCARLC